MPALQHPSGWLDMQYLAEVMQQQAVAMRE
jgi:hypothetical protein